MQNIRIIGKSAESAPFPTYPTSGIDIYTAEMPLPFKQLGSLIGGRSGTYHSQTQNGFETSSITPWSFTPYLQTDYVVFNGRVWIATVASGNVQVWELGPTLADLPTLKYTNSAGVWSDARLATSPGQIVLLCSGGVDQVVLWHLSSDGESWSAHTGSRPSSYPIASTLTYIPWEGRYQCGLQYITTSGAKGGHLAENLFHEGATNASGDGLIGVSGNRYIVEYDNAGNLISSFDTTDIGVPTANISGRTQLGSIVSQGSYRALAVQYARILLLSADGGVSYRAVAAPFSTPTSVGLAIHNGNWFWGLTNFSTHSTILAGSFE